MRRIIVDANMIFVFVVGQIDPGLLGVIKRAKEYRPGDYDLIFTYLSLFTEVILLPNTLTEASNLIDQMKGERRQECMALLACLSQASSEIYVPSALAAEQPEYPALGMSDAAILCALGKDTYLLTADRALFLAAILRNHEAQYFADLRQHE